MTDISKITLYSGGHKGTEAEFGRLAEAWNLQEVNISFEGHKAERTRGVRLLDREELRKGDVSMEIVSKRMNRTYSRTDKIRSVIQSIFHMVNKGYHVIAVGWIQAVFLGKQSMGREHPGDYFRDVCRHRYPLSFR